MSADILLTPNAGVWPVVTHEPGSDLRFHCVAGAGFEPATSGFECRIRLTNLLTFHSTVSHM